MRVKRRTVRPMMVMSRQFSLLLKWSSLWTDIWPISSTRWKKQRRATQMGRMHGPTNNGRRQLRRRPNSSKDESLETTVRKENLQLNLSFKVLHLFFLK